MCVATMDTPVPGFHFWGSVKASSAVWFLDVAQDVSDRQDKERGEQLD